MSIINICAQLLWQLSGGVPCDQSLEAIKYNSCKKDRECVKAKKEVFTIFVQIFVSFA